MKRTIGRLASCLLTGIICGLGLPFSAVAGWHVFQHENVLGTSLELKFNTPSRTDAEKAEASALAEIDRLARILSTYDPGSEASRWLRTSREPVKLSPELFEVLGLFDQWRTRTDGALDPAAEVVCRLWKNASARQSPPTETEIQKSVASVHQTHWTLDAATRTGTRLSDTPIVLNSLAKSWIIERACAAAMAAVRVEGAVVNIGGDLVVRGAFPEIVEIADPKSGAENAIPIARLSIRDRAVATSGSYRRGVQIGGEWYSHIVDPRTGRPAGEVISATVAGPNAAEAGALATAFCVLKPEESLRLAASVPEVDCLIVTADGRRVSSPGWSRLEARAVELASTGPVAALPAAPAADAAAANLWDTKFELVVNLELSRIEQRYKKPFVAVWIEDADKFPVRTLALWFSKPKWLPDLKAWKRGDQLRALTDGTDLTRSVSSATRSPGKYSLVWDGKDDKGALVKPGKYTVHIEAAREHGTHQLMRQEMDFNGAPSQVEIKGNIEVASATLDYRKKSESR